jgi:uncharacterized caspase-like protein
VNNARLIASKFRLAGFDVFTRYDVGILELKRAIRQFKSAAADSDIAVVYYGGYGLDINGTNYLLPIDARLASDWDADDEAIPIERLIDSVDNTKTGLIILDACGYNPFAQSMKRQRTNSSFNNVGLCAIASPPSRKNLLIVYAGQARESGP